MDEPGVGEERDLPPRVAHPAAQVDVLEIHVEALVEAARVAERGRADHHRGAVDPVDPPDALAARHVPAAR